MQRKFNRNRSGRQLFFMLMMGAALLVGCSVKAQTEFSKYIGYLKGIKDVMNYQNISYRYSVNLYDQASKRETDQIEGKLFKQGKAYLDSNARSFTLSSDGYLLKLRMQEKVADVYKWSTVEKKLGVKNRDVELPFLSIPDSMLLQSGRFVPISEGEVLDFRYVLNDNSGPVSEIRFRIREKDKYLLEIILLMPDGKGYNRTFRLYDFDNLFDVKRMGMSRYCKISGEKATMQAPFQSFKVNATL